MKYRKDFMRRSHSLFTEWAWLEGQLRGSADIDALAVEFHNWLAAKYPLGNGSRDQAIKHIHSDMKRTYRALSYGGRGTQEIHFGRQRLLRTEALTSGWREVIHRENSSRQAA